MPHRRAFTLLEVVVALVVFSFGLLALQAATAVLLRHARAARDQGLANEVASSRRERLHWHPCEAQPAGTETVRGIRSLWADAGALGGSARLVVHSVGFGEGAAARLNEYHAAVRCR